jgi:hypothetical protein
MSKHVPAAAAIFVALMLTACAGAFAADDEAQPILPRSELVIDTAKGPLQFTVELAATPRQQERGLMFRNHLAPDEGMLFDFGNDGDRVFWMKNTIIPLDMLFIRSDGTIVNVVSNAKPMSEDHIASEAPVQAVLEIAGGRAAEAGIKRGDKVHHAIFVRPPASRFP